MTKTELTALQNVLVDIPETEEIEKIHKKLTSKQKLTDEQWKELIGVVSLDSTTKFIRPITISNKISSEQSSAENTEATEKAKTASEIISKLLPQQQSSNQNLSGIKLVYIQYDTDKTKAQNFQKYLQSQGVLAPGIEQISGIKENDIRYSNPEDLDKAEKLKQEVAKQGIKIDKLIDLSQAGYKVPSGQFEIWLK